VQVAWLEKDLGVRLFERRPFLAHGEMDLAIVVLDSNLPPGFCSVTLARLPLSLLVRADQPYLRAAALLKEGAAGKVPLISLPPHELLPRLFQKEMMRGKQVTIAIRRNIVWRTAMETSSQDSVSIYVRNGLGAGLPVLKPDLRRYSELRVLR
jgi:DNA-binding transcriptional LysR family regulator